MGSQNQVEFRIPSLPLRVLTRSRLVLDYSGYSGAKRMKHSEGFLKIVNDSKSRIKEVTVAETRDRLKENPDAKLIDGRRSGAIRDGPRFRFTLVSMATAQGGALTHLPWTRERILVTGGLMLAMFTAAMDATAASRT